MEQLNKEENDRLIHSLDEKIQETEKKLEEQQKLENEFAPIWNSALTSQKRIGKPTAIIIKSKEEPLKNKLSAKISRIKNSILHHQKRDPPVENRFRTEIEGHGIIINPMFEILEREESVGHQESGEGTSVAPENKEEEEASESDAVKSEDGEKEGKEEEKEKKGESED